MLSSPKAFPGWDPIGWRRYLESYWGVELLLEAPGWREYRIDNPSGPVICRSMLMRYEFAMLYALTRDHYSGAGAVIDAGSLTGITTNALVKGVLANRSIQDRKRRVFAFDLFDYIVGQETLENVPNRNGSIMDTFLEVNRDYLDLISVAPGNLLSHAWNSGPIEIALVDLAKSWDLNSFVVDQWFPSLFPGGLVVQQDYCSYFTYWLPLTMAYLKDHFELLDYAMGGSVIFRCIKPVPPGMGAVIRRLPFERHEELFDEAIASVPLSIAPLITLAKACFYVAYGMIDKANNAIETTNTSRISDDPATDFHGVAGGSVAPPKCLSCRR